MKKNKKWLVFTLSLLLIYSGYLAYRHYHIHNIFDEIYYNQKNSWTPKLESIEGVSNPASGEPILDQLTYEDYDESRLPESVTDLGYVFNFLDGYLAFEIRYDIGKGDSQTLNISYRYDVRDRHLSRKLWVFKGSSHNKNQDDIRIFLEDHNSSIDECIEFGDRIVREVLLNDWCSVYNSRFSPEDWGDVTVETQWED